MTDVPNGYYTHRSGSFTDGTAYLERTPDHWIIHRSDGSASRWSTHGGAGRCHAGDDAVRSGTWMPYTGQINQPVEVEGLPDDARWLKTDPIEESLNDVEIEELRKQLAEALEKIASLESGDSITLLSLKDPT